MRGLTPKGGFEVFEEFFPVGQMEAGGAGAA
jgi:hypothetical protein